MGYREYGMWEVLEVLRRYGRGESKAQIARGTGHSRFTVRRYIELAGEVGWKPEDGEPQEKLASEVLQKCRPGPREVAAGKPSNEQRLLVHIEELRGWLAPADGSRALRLSRVQTLLKQRHGLEVSYSGLRRFAQTYCQFGTRAVTVRMADTEPGEIAECDFGRLGYVPDADAGKRRLVHALIVTLPYSRHQYVYVTHHQTVRDVITGLEAAWEFFGGVPKRLIVDNMKAAVTRADRYEPTFQRTFNEYAQYRGFVIDAAVARHPTGKPHVERNVQYVRESLFRGGDWHDLAHVQREAERWCREQAGKRIHGTTRQMPLLVFEQQERAVLGGLDKRRFDPPHWAVCKVHPDHTISFLLSFYSVPTRYIGKEVDVRGDQHLVRVFLKGELIKTHEVVAPGKKSIDYNDYPPDKAPYAMRDVDRMVQDARAIGKHAGQFMEKLLGTHCPWSKLRQGHKLLRLARKYGCAVIDDACHCAISFDLINVRRLDAIVLQALQQRADVAPVSVTSPPDSQLGLRFLRQPGSFSPSPTIEKETTHGDPSHVKDCA
jgi:transposase